MDSRSAAKSTGKQSYGCCTVWVPLRAGHGRHTRRPPVAPTCCIICCWASHPPLARPPGSAAYLPVSQAGAAPLGVARGGSQRHQPGLAQHWCPGLLQSRHPCLLLGQLPLGSLLHRLCCLTGAPACLGDLGRRNPCTRATRVCRVLSHAGMSRPGSTGTSSIPLTPLRLTARCLPAGDGCCAVCRL